MVSNAHGQELLSKAVTSHLQSQHSGDRGNQGHEFKVNMSYIVCPVSEQRRDRGKSS